MLAGGIVALEATRVVVLEAATAKIVALERAKEVALEAATGGDVAG